MTDDNTHWRDFDCPECGEPADALLSGNVEEYTETTFDTEGIGSLCVIGPNDEHDHTTLYFHPER